MHGRHGRKDQGGAKSHGLIGHSPPVGAAGHGMHPLQSVVDHSIPASMPLPKAKYRPSHTGGVLAVSPRGAHGHRPHGPSGGAEQRSPGSPRGAGASPGAQTVPLVGALLQQNKDQRKHVNAAPPLPLPSDEGKDRVQQLR